MAVDYSKYKSSSTYTTTKDLYETQKNSAKKTDRISTMQTYASGGSSLGGAIGAIWGTAGSTAGSAIGYLAGGGLGLLASALGIWDITAQQDAFKAQAISARNNLANEAVTSTENKNTAVTNAKHFVNSTRTSYNRTYGEGEFEKIEEAVMGTLGLTDSTVLSKVVASLQYDKIAGDMVTRLVSSEYGDGIYNSSDLTSLLESNFSLSELGKGYTDALYEAYLSSTTTETGDTARQLSENLDDTMSEISSNAGTLQSQYAQQFLSAFYNMEENELSMASSLGNAQNSEASSGIRVTKATASKSKLQQYKADLARASYASTIEYYRNQLIQSVNSLETSRTQAFRSYQNNLIALKRKVRNGVEDSINDYLYGTGTQLTSVSDAEKAVDTDIANALAINSQITGATDADVENMLNVSTVSTSTK